MKRSLLMGTLQGIGILAVLLFALAVAFAADILTVDKDGTIRLRVSDTGKVTLNTSDAAEGDLRFTPRTADPTAPLAGDLWFNSADREVKYADGGLTKPLADMTNAAISLYVDGTTGNDNNNGLASGTAVKTIQKAVNLVPPIVRHAVTINVAAGTYRDLGATVGGNTMNVYVADKTVCDTGSITFKGSTTQAGASSYRVTGSDASADTTPVRSIGFYVSGVKNIHVDGFLCNYFAINGIFYQYYASGNPNNCLCNNNTGNGIYYASHSLGSPNNCQANSNLSAGITYNSISAGNPNTCTANNNTNFGFVVSASSRVNPNTCTANGNTYGFLIQMGSSVSATSCTANSNTYVGFCVQSIAQANFTSCTANSNTSHGMYISVSAAVPVGCFTSLNGGYGIYYAYNSVGNASNCTSPSGNNTSGGLRAEYGSRVDYTDPMPNANNRTADAASQVW